MSEIEVPLENTQEHLLHASVHGGDSLINTGALLSAVFAVFAAITALFAGHFSNEALIQQIKASDQWSYYQAKGVKSSLQELRLDLNKQADGAEAETIKKKIEKYKSEQEEIQEKASHHQESGEQYLHWHERLAMAVTFFQVAIGIVAIGVLTRKKTFVRLGGLCGLIGIGSLLTLLLKH